MPILEQRKAVAAVAIAAVAFGTLTLIAGARVLLGSDPGYVVFRPVLQFNTVMGVVYATVGVITWRNLRLGIFGAAAICALNVVALGAISYLYVYAPNGGIATTSLQAMTFRTVVWLVFLLVLAWASRAGTDRK